MAQMTKKQTTKRKSGSSKSKGGQGKKKGSAEQDKGGQGKEPTLHEQVQATIKKLQAEDPGLKQLMKKAHGYAVFPSVAKAALVVGGAYGLGEVYEQGKVIGHATIGQLTIGVQIGGDTFDELIVFEDEEPFERFKESRMKFAANASAVLVKAGAAASSNFEKGATVFVYAEGGMLLELAIGGQKFRFKPGEPGDEVADDDDKEASSKSGSSEDDEEEDDQDGSEDDEQDSSSTLGKATKALQFARNHPVWAALIGAGVAFYAVSRLMSGSSSGGEEDDSEEDQDEDDEEGSYDDEEDDEQDDDREEDDEQDEDSDEDEDDDESEDEDEDEADEDDDDEEEEDEEEESSSRPSRSRR